MNTITYHINLPFDAVTAVLDIWNTHSSELDEPSISIAESLVNGIVQVVETYENDRPENDLHHAACDVDTTWFDTIINDASFADIDPDSFTFKLISIA